MTSNSLPSQSAWPGFLKTVNKDKHIHYCSESVFTCLSHNSHPVFQKARTSLATLQLIISLNPVGSTRLLFRGKTLIWHGRTVNHGRFHGEPHREIRLQKSS
jgi:hypothetical protein